MEIFNDEVKVNHDGAVTSLRTSFEGEMNFLLDEAFRSYTHTHIHTYKNALIVDEFASHIRMLSYSLSC